MNRIYLTDLPADIITAFEKFQKEYDDVFDTWFAWGKKALGHSDFKIYAGRRLTGLVLTKKDNTPEGWNNKNGAISPNFYKLKELNQEFKKLPTKPDWDTFGEYAGLRGQFNGDRYMMPTMEKIGNMYVLSIPVSGEGKHDPIPEGARELTTTQYLGIREMMKGEANG